MKAKLLRPQHASINVSASAGPQLCWELGRGHLRLQSYPQRGLLPTSTLLSGMGRRAAGLGGGRGLVTSQTGSLRDHSPHAGRSTADVLTSQGSFLVRVRAPGSSVPGQSEGRVQIDQG